MTNGSHPQYSLQALMALAAVAAFVALLGTMSRWYADPIVLLLSIIAGPMLAVGITWGGRWLRAFCIGAIVPAGSFAIGNLVAVHRVAMSRSQTIDYFDHVFTMFAG